MVGKLVTALALFSLGACGGPSLVDVPKGVTLRVEQTRSGLMSRAIQMQVANQGPRTLKVSRIEFSSKRFDKSAVWTGPSDVEAGTTKNLRIDMPKARCGKGIDATMRLTYAVDGGKEVESEVPARDHYGSVGLFMKRDCAQRALAKAARLTVSGPRVAGVGGDAVAHLDLTLTPTGARDEVKLKSIDSTVMLKFAPGFDGEIGKSAGAAPLKLDIPVVPSRCDAHVVAEDKAGTLFPVNIVSKRSGKAFFYLPLTEAQRSRIFDYLADYCDFGNE